MYVCGITVYDLLHIGHARAMIAFDVVQRWLKASGYAVDYARNITDIDDKIIRRALQNNEPIRALTARMIAAMYTDADALFIERPTHDPRATDHVPQMVSMIETLESKALAYRSDSGDVNFAVRRFDDYGRLSGKSIDELQAGERVTLIDDKRDPFDFVLWKAAKPSEPNDAQWSSPWGAGRPGWHIECSAMCKALLGDTVDIHGGGADLLFPHHENELAQSVGANGVPLARVWMHNGFVNIDDEKMSKSLGNFFTVRDVLQRYEAEVVRFFVVRSHYRSPLNYSDAHLDDARGALRRLYTALAEAPAVDGPVTIDWAEPRAARFQMAMNDDFGTPDAVAVLFELAGSINRTGVGARCRPAAWARWLARDLASRAACVLAGPQHSKRRRARRRHDRIADRRAGPRQGCAGLRHGRPDPAALAGTRRHTEGFGRRYAVGGDLLNVLIERAANGVPWKPHR